MTMAPLSERAKQDASELYEEMRGLTIHTIQQFMRRYGGSFDDLESHANEIFVKAYAKWNPEVAKFTTWYRNMLWHDFLGQKMRAVKFDKRFNVKPLPERPLPGGDLLPTTVLSDLSADARQVASLVIESPSELLAMMRMSSSRTGKHELRTYLARQLGWTGGRITTAFSELGSCFA
jgi:DNA-directed RNA polymerase specialized sigma24 family protein